MYNEFKEVAKKPTVLASLIGFINPITIIPIVAIGVVAIVAKQRNKLETENDELLASKNALTKRTVALQDELDGYYDAEHEAIEEGDNESLLQPLNGSKSAENHVALTVEQPLNLTVNNGTSSGSPTVENMSDEALKKEMLRQTMSELGKRSAAKRKQAKGNNPLCPNLPYTQEL